MKRSVVLGGVAAFALAACSSSSPTLPRGEDGGLDGAAPDAARPPEAEPAEVTGCDAARLYDVPSDPSRRGPWPVGARTVTVGRLTAEVWYPAPLGSESGAAPAVYDLRLALPPSQRATIPDADNPWQTCACHRELPLDTAHGPYPVVVFVHGTAAFRTQSLSLATHWASRGFVVIAADHPGLQLGDMLSFLCPDSPSGARDLVGDVDAMLAALAAPSDALAFLADHLDLSRVAVVGHSAGGAAAAALAGRDGVRVVMPLAAGSTVQVSDALDYSLFVTGMADSIAKLDRVYAAYEASPPAKGLVAIRDAGHLVVSDLCALANDAGENMLQVAQRHGICGTGLAGGLFDCSPDYVSVETGLAITGYATAAVLETSLHCIDRGDALSSIEERFPEVGELREQR